MREPAGSCLIFAVKYPAIDLDGETADIGAEIKALTETQRRPLAGRVILIVKLLRIEEKFRGENWGVELLRLTVSRLGRQLYDHHALQANLVMLQPLSTECGIDERQKRTRTTPWLRRYYKKHFNCFHLHPGSNTLAYCSIYQPGHSPKYPDLATCLKTEEL